LTVGQVDTGQLGLGEKTRPGLVKEVEDAVAGGMHTVVWTFGCNDEGSLGRVVGEEEECFVPGQVCLPAPGAVVQVSAGDSQSVALTALMRARSGCGGLSGTALDPLAWQSGGRWRRT